MIYLSMSSIKDFLRCSKMFYYRKNYAEEAVDALEASVGTVVHKIIETYPTGPYDPQVLATLVREKDIDLSGEVKLLRLLDNYYTKFPHILEKMKPETDKSEFYFQEKISGDVTLAGKMDYILRDEHIVYDWKTGQTKRDISNDIQFIIYYTVYQVNLNKCEETLYIPRKIYIDALYEQIIPKIVSAIQNKEYFKEGYFNGSCFRCNFIAVCARDPQEE